jgi:hypothetical protein
MFGKYHQSIDTTLDANSLHEAIQNWASENELIEVKSSEHAKLYRFGSPFLSNPIYIQLELNGKQIDLSGWVQTILPILRWKLVPTSKSDLGTTIDYRRKGGLFCTKLRELIA